MAVFHHETLFSGQPRFFSRVFYRSCNAPHPVFHLHAVVSADTYVLNRLSTRESASRSGSVWSCHALDNSGVSAFSDGRQLHLYSSQVWRQFLQGQCKIPLCRPFRSSCRVVHVEIHPLDKLIIADASWNHSTHRSLRTSVRICGDLYPGVRKRLRNILCRVGGAGGKAPQHNHFLIRRPRRFSHVPLRIRT